MPGRHRHQHADIVARAGRFQSLDACEGFFPGNPASRKIAVDPFQIFFHLRHGADLIDPYSRVGQYMETLLRM